MKTLLMATMVVIGSMGAALADDATIPNSTNQHGRDRADFYGSVPDFRTLGRGAEQDQRSTLMSETSSQHQSVTVR